ncbi:bifunctional 4-hydroxy-2-oxoglutarate aldolase/2-dehydro-3-deoxy-phosphogluconate aldolase [Neobacillus muris]|uniref:bifunctional 4-hydroxy-2-oxoglutarate aldolase/2-dehydro-3-deoxy-phosphogluconate aldolase n=1 Tax=Neobacillus muris TaxID=2941334 RepID=UPI00203FED3F|nr:bifunctional 4-hydroxy-2-oxoglutarate aldolase/2-dehydro-3-deoxy-phosphogluconate aldolase [Neobacillus muris]
MDLKSFPKITFILRGFTYKQVRQVVGILLDTKINSLEIPLNSPNAFDTIKKINEEFGDKIVVGAGTVLNHENAVKSIEAGAKFLLSPIMMSRKTIEYCKENRVISIPAAFSPTEVYQSFQDGADIVKIFPAARLGSKYISDIRAPLGEMPLMAVGGVNSDNAEEFFKAGTSFLGIGSGIFNLESLENGETEQLKMKIRKLEKLL